MAVHLGNKFRVSLVAALCLLALVVTLKNILLVPTLVLTRDIVLYIMLYTILGVLCPDKREASRSSLAASPWFWSMLIVLITIGIIAVYAI